MLEISRIWDTNDNTNSRQNNGWNIYLFVKYYERVSRLFITEMEAST